jgi:four helix bundle protein
VRYTEWQSTVPADVTAAALWQRHDYRLALYAADLGWHDVRRLSGVRATADVARQLGPALGAIGANIAEGARRAPGRARARHYEYALGAVRESREWYHRAGHVLGPDVARHRLRVLANIARLLRDATAPGRSALNAVRTSSPPSASN